MIVTEAVSAPFTMGAKCPWMVQFAPAARLVPQLFANTNEEALVPVTAMLEIERVALPEFTKVTNFDAVAVPTGDEPKDRLVVERVTAGPRPVPVRAMVCGDPVALSMIVMAAFRVP